MYHHQCCSSCGRNFHKILNPPSTHRIPDGWLAGRLAPLKPKTTFEFIPHFSAPQKNSGVGGHFWNIIFIISFLVIFAHAKYQNPCRKIGVRKKETNNNGNQLYNCFGEYSSESLIESRFHISFFRSVLFLEKYPLLYTNQDIFKKVKGSLN